MICKNVKIFFHNKKYTAYKLLVYKLTYISVRFHFNLLSFNNYENPANHKRKKSLPFLLYLFLLNDKKEYLWFYFPQWIFEIAWALVLVESCLLLVGSKSKLFHFNFFLELLPIWNIIHFLLCFFSKLLFLLLTQNWKAILN